VSDYNSDFEPTGSESNWHVVLMVLGGLAVAGIVGYVAEKREERRFIERTKKMLKHSEAIRI